MTGARTCRKRGQGPAQPFAHVYNGQPYQDFVIELGGCNQMLDSDGYIRQLDPAIVALLR